MPNTLPRAHSRFASFALLLLLPALVAGPTSTSPSPPFHPHFPKVLECRIAKDLTITLRYQTVTFNAEAAKKLAPGKAWHLAGASFETTGDLVVGGQQVKAGRYALSARKLAKEQWELVLHEGEGFSTKIGPDAHVLTTTFVADAPLFEHLCIDVQPGGDKKHTELHLDVRFDRLLARARIEIPRVSSDAEPLVTGRATTDLRLTARASGFARRGQPWFYADDVVAGDVAPPRLVRVRDEEGRDLGLGITGPSKLALRLCGPWPGDGVPDREAFFHTRLQAAIEARVGQLGGDDGARLVHGEGDWLPGLVLDRYGSVLVLQVTSAFVEQALDAIVPFVAERLGAESVVARNDVAARRHEGLVEEVRLLHGRRIVETGLVEHGVRHAVFPFTGHKTGWYLDQRPARGLVQQLAKGRRVLDLFCYQGGFALNALRGGAVAVDAVDQSAEALEVANAGAKLNGLAGLSTHSANVFDFLRARREAQASYDLIVLDPPAFAKSRREVEGAERGYRDLNRQALRLLSPNGFLVTCSCSHHMTWPRLQEVVRQAAAGLPFHAVLQQRLSAGPDHPVPITHPESEYLKVLLLQRRDGS